MIPHRRPSLLLPAFRVELLEVGPQVLRLGLVLDAGEHHLGSGNLGLRVLDGVEELRVSPDDAETSVRALATARRLVFPPLRDPQRAAAQGIRRRRALERDDFSSNRRPALSYAGSMIFSENRFPL